VPLEPFLAGQAAEMVGFAFIGDFELCCVFVENHAADWVSVHYFSLYLDGRVCFCLFMVSGDERVLLGSRTKQSCSVGFVTYPL